jgi:hypothetical protein
MHATGKVNFDGFVPYSLFVFDVHPSPQVPYWYVSEPYALWASILLGNIGIVASFQDDGYIARDVTRANVTRDISPITVAQFGDFSSYILHLKRRMKPLPNYLVTQCGHAFTVRIQPEPEGSRYDPPNQAELLEFLSRMFMPLLHDHMEQKNDGTTVVSYRSPFVYF